MIVYGKQIFLYILQKHPDILKRALFSKRVDNKIIKELNSLNIPILNIDNKKAQSLAHGGNHQGHFAEIGDFRFLELSDLKNRDFLLLLYGITDVGNIGSIIRTSYALGADGVIISNIKNIKVENIIRTSSGAALDLPIVNFFDANDAINQLKTAGFTIYGASLDGEDVRGVKFERKKVLILGSEGEGIPSKILKKCSKRVKIVMDRDFDSLNVSAAAAILCDRIRDG